MHDLFNWCTIILLLPLEIGTGLFEKLTGAILELKFFCSSDCFSGYVSESVLGLHEHSTTKNINFHFGKLFSIFTDYLVMLKSNEEISKEKLFLLTLFLDNMSNLNQGLGKSLLDSSLIIDWRFRKTLGYHTFSKGSFINDSSKKQCRTSYIYYRTAPWW